MPAQRSVTRTETQTWAGSGEGRVNEDYALIDAEGGFAVIVDGATGLTKVNLVTGESDASWFARTLTQALCKLLAQPTIATAEALERAGAKVAEAYLQLPGADATARIDQPNGSLAVLRWNQGVTEVTLLGDCTAVVLLQDGTARVLHDDTLTKLDDENYERMYRYATEHGATMTQARKALNPRFIENRLKMNEPGGYWAADISCRGMGHAQSTCFVQDDVAALFACSDGFTAAVDMGVVSGADELARQLAAGRGELVGKRLREAELLDADCWHVHRSKTSDDATYAVVVF